MTLPTGTVTFLFTDIEGSTRLMAELGDRYVELQLTHHQILRQAFRNHSGSELRTEGDSFFCVFASALDACSAAASAQRSLHDHAWPEGGPLRVRMGLHTGEAPLMGNEYIGLDVHHAARVSGAAWGGQVLISEATRGLVAPALPSGLSLRDLGLHRLKDMSRPERLYQLVIEGVPADFPALRTLDATPNNLPTQLTSFVGRAGVVAEAKRVLDSTRLLTLTGPGGIGKTRLSLQLAAEVFDRFPDGVYFVPLSAVRDAALVPSVIAQALSLPVTGQLTPLEALTGYLASRKVLLVLDNMEQLLGAASGLPSQLLGSGEGLKIVVSSRSPLRAYGEREFAVEPLQLPDLKKQLSLAALSQYEAVKLFIERAVAAKSDFQATNENAPAIAGICERVDGLPLAIELAAARVKLFSPQALLTRLEKSLSALGSGARDLPGRQQTLRGAIAWSHDMLDEPGRRLLSRFSVFARSAALDQAEGVCGPAEEIGVDVLAGLDELADQSLLRRQPDFDEPRLLMLQTIRDFAAEQLEASGEAELMRDRHSLAFQSLAEKAEPHLVGERQKAWLDRLERDHDNFRAAIEWCIARGHVNRAMGIGRALWRFWQMRGHLHEGRARLDAVLALPASHADPVVRRGTLEAAGGIAYWQGDLPAAIAYYDECLALARASGDRAAIANALYNDSFPRSVDRSDMKTAHRLLDEALPIYRELGDSAGIAKCLWITGNLLYFEQQEDEAIGYLDEAIGRFRALQDRFQLGWALHTRSLIAIKKEQAAIARPLVREALEIFRAAGDVSGLIILLDDYSQIARLEGSVLDAIRIAGAASALQNQTGAGLAEIINVVEGRTHEGGADQDEEKAWADGRAMNIDEIMALVSDTRPREARKA